MKKLIKSSALEDAFTVYPWSSDVSYIDGDSGLGLSYVVEAYGDEFMNLDESTLEDSRDILERYFDDEAYVRDFNINNPDEQIESVYDIDDPENFSVEELARYFDYDAYGRDIRLENNMIWDNNRECWFSGNDTDDYNEDDVTFLGSSKRENGKKVVKSSRKPIKSAVDGGWRVDSSDVPEALDLFVEYVGEETALEEIARAMGTDVLEENIDYVAQQWGIAEDIEDLDAWDAYEKAKEIMGVSELFTNLTQAAGYDELAEDLAFIFRQYDFREWDKYDSNDEE